MIRFVADEPGRLRPDPWQRMPGRGGYLCPCQKCAEAALRRGGFNRALRRRVVAPALEELWSGTRSALEAASRELLTRAIGDGRARLLDVRSGVGTVGDVGTWPAMGDPQAVRVTDERCSAQLRLLGEQLEELGGWMLDPKMGRAHSRGRCGG